MKIVLKRKSGSRIGGGGGEEEENVPFPGIRHHDMRSPPTSPKADRGDHNDEEEEGGPVVASGSVSPPFPGVRFHLPETSSPVSSSSPESVRHDSTFRPLADQARGSGFSPARPLPYLLSTHGGGASNIGCRETMEDAHAVHDRQGAPWRDLRRGRQTPVVFPNDSVAFYAVCDGHAGKAAANLSAEILPLHVVQTKHFVDGDMREALREGFKKADEVILATPDPGAVAATKNTSSEDQSASADHEQAVPEAPPPVVSPPPAARRLNKSHGQGGLDGRHLHIGQIKELKSMEKVGGSCVVACMVVGHRIFVANVGDCEAVLARWQPALEQYQGVVLTEKHRVSEKKERERINGLGGTVIFGRLFGDLSVTRALGDREYKKPLQAHDFVSCDPHISCMRLRPDDEFVILGCDGLWDHVAYDAAIDIVAGLKKAGRSAEMAAEALVQEALNQHSTDNITCVVIYFRWQKAERPPSRIYMRSNSSTFHKRRSTTIGPSSPGRASPATAPSSPGWVRSLPRGLSQGKKDASTKPAKKEETEAAAAERPKPDKGEATHLWRNKSSLGLKAAFSATAPRASAVDSPCSPNKRRVSVVVNWSTLKREDREELEDDGWIIDDVVVQGDETKEDSANDDGEEQENGDISRASPQDVDATCQEEANDGGDATRSEKSEDTLEFQE